MLTALRTGYSKLSKSGPPYVFWPIGWADTLIGAKESLLSGEMRDLREANGLHVASNKNALIKPECFGSLVPHTFGTQASHEHIRSGLVLNKEYKVVSAAQFLLIHTWLATDGQSISDVYGWKLRDWMPPLIMRAAKDIYSPAGAEASLDLSETSKLVLQAVEGQTALPTLAAKLVAARATATPPVATPNSAAYRIPRRGGSAAASSSAAPASSNPHAAQHGISVDLSNDDEPGAAGARAKGKRKGGAQEASAAVDLLSDDDDELELLLPDTELAKPQAPLQAMPQAAGAKAMGKRKRDASSDVSGGAKISPAAARASAVTTTTMAEAPTAERSSRVPGHPAAASPVVGSQATGASAVSPGTAAATTSQDVADDAASKRSRQLEAALSRCNQATACTSAAPPALAPALAPVPAPAPPLSSPAKPASSAKEQRGASSLSNDFTLQTKRVTMGTWDCGPATVTFSANNIIWTPEQTYGLAQGVPGTDEYPLISVPMATVTRVEVDKMRGALAIWSLWDAPFDLHGRWKPMAGAVDPASSIYIQYDAAPFQGNGPPWPSGIFKASEKIRSMVSFVGPGLITGRKSCVVAKPSSSPRRQKKQVATASPAAATTSATASPAVVGVAVAKSVSSQQVQSSPNAPQLLAQSPARPLPVTKVEGPAEAQVTALQEQLAAMRRAEEVSCGYRVLALEAHIQTARQLYLATKKKETKKHVLRLRRRCLAADVLWEMHKLSPGVMLYAPLTVQYEGEKGKDDTGLTADMLSNFHRSCYKDLGRFFSEHGSCVLPVTDRESATRVEPLQLPLQLPADHDGGGDEAGTSGSTKRFPWEQLVAGTRVEAKWKASSFAQGTPYYKAVVDVVHADGSCDVTYDEDGEGERVRYKWLKVDGVPVAAPVNAGAAAPSAPPEPPKGTRSRNGGKGRAAATIEEPHGEAVSVSCDSQRVMRLCGRLLATSLVLGDGYFVDDRMPLYVLEYLATDNFCLLDTLSSALEQLESVEPAYANMLRQYLTQGVDAAAQAMGVEALTECDLWPPDVPCPNCARTRDFSQACACARLTDAKLYAADEGNLVHEAIKDVLVRSRRENLQALKFGFQGGDNLTAEDVEAGKRSCYDFSYDLASLPPTHFAFYLRGRQMSDAHELMRLLSFRRVDEFHHDVEKCPPVTQEIAGRVREWFESVVAAFDAHDVTTFLMFATGRRAISAARSSDPERDAINVCVYEDVKEYDAAKEWREEMTAQTCSRLVFLPWCAGMTRESFEKCVRSALTQLVLEEKLMAGGAAIDYA